MAGFWKLNLIKKVKRHGRRRIDSRGYTLLELMTVSAIISILAAMSIGLLSRARSQAIETTALSALNALATGYEMYYFYNKSYPQWGPGQRFSSPLALWNHLVDEEFIGHSYRNIEYDPNTGYIYGFTTDYAVEIPEPDPLLSSRETYFIVFHPYNFQRDALAIGHDPNPPPLPNYRGWVAVRARRGPRAPEYRSFNHYVFKRGGAED